MRETFDSVFQGFMEQLYVLDCNNFECDNPCKYEYQIHYEESCDKLLALVRPEDRKQARKYLEDMSYGESLEIAYHRRCMLRNTIRTLKYMGAL